MAVANPPSHHMSSAPLLRASDQIQRMVPLAESHCLPQAVFPGRLSVNVSPECQQQQRQWEHFYPQHEQRRQHEQQEEQQQEQRRQQEWQQQQNRPASLLWHGVAKKRCFAWNTERSSLPPHFAACWRAAADVAAATAANAAAPTAATRATVPWMVSKSAAAAGAAGDSAGPKDPCSPLMTPHNGQFQRHHHPHNHHGKAPVKGCAEEEGDLVHTSPASSTSTTSTTSAASNGSARNLNDEECIPWCSDGSSQSPSFHHWGAQAAAHEAGCATWQPEAAIQGLQHAAVFPCSFDPEAGGGDTAPSANTHTPFPKVPVSHGLAVAPLPIIHPTPHAYHVPTFALLLNSISPARQHHRRVASAPAASAVCSSCNLSVSPCLPVKEGLLPPKARAQQQEKENGGARVVCSVSFSGKTCVFDSPSLGSHCSQQQQEERWGRRVQDLVTPGDALLGLHELHSAAGPGNRTVSASPTEGSEDDGNLEELQDTASS